MTARLLVVQHEPDAPLAWLREWWAAEGLGVEVVRGDLGERMPPRVEHDGLVVLGGAMGAHDDARHPWLAPTKALIRDVVQRDVPLLGVCLGHQLAAAALGGRCGPNPAGRTVGLAPVQLTAAGATDPLLRGFNGLDAVHYNDDVVSALPRRAQVLATLPGGAPQAVRFGIRAWGVQFHPEASPEVFASWVEADPPVVPHHRRVGARAEPVATGRDLVAELVADVAASEERLRAAWQPLARRFAELVTSSCTVAPRPAQV
ncbi:MAG: type 1 glutamine amidotransferase [Dermatophilaceae bacterium]